MAGSRGIYFACDDNPRVLFQLRTCVQSIRASGCDLPIHVVLVGEAPRATLDVLAGHSAQVIVRRWQDYPRHVRRQPTFLKWAALQEGLAYDELLFLDADTFAFRDPGELFDAVGPEDLHARCSYQAMETGDLMTRGLLLVRPPGCLPSYLRRYQELRGLLRVEPVLGLNSGIMVFKNGAQQRLQKHPALFGAIRRMFWNGLLPYPMPLRMNVMDEVVARLALGALGGFTCKEIPEELCPYYLESFHALGQRPAILTHTFRGQYAHFLFTRFGKQACQGYLDIEERSSGLGRLRFAGLWAWIALLHGSGLTRLGRRWKCAVASRRLGKLLDAEHDAAARSAGCGARCPRAFARFEHQPAGRR